MSAGVNGELIPQGGGDTIPLVRERMTAGRRESCDICLRFPNVSGQHCEFVFRDGYWSIRDLNSTNGIKVNEQRVLQKPLRPGDEVTIGKRKYTIQYTLPSAGQLALEEVLNEGEDILSQSLLEKAGLQQPRRRDEDDD
jgi:adenylate cyclase